MKAHAIDYISRLSKTSRVLLSFLGLAGWVGMSPALAGERLPLAQISHIHGIAADPASPGAVFLASHYGLFHATPDGTAERVSLTTDDFMGFTPHPSDPKVFFASGHPQSGGNMGIVRSNDGGVSWDPLALGVKGPVDFHAMDISKGNPFVMYGVSGGLQLSRDQGRTWDMVGPVPEGLLDLAVGTKDSNLLYAATRTGLMISRDGGRSWNPGHTLNVPVTMVDVAVDGRVYAYLFNQGLMRADEGRPNWFSLGTIPGENVLLHFAAGSDGLYAVRQDGAVLKSLDDGKSWRPLASK